MSRLVEASAGTGKTRWLVQRIADVIESGVAMEGIAAVTFTKAAAGGLKLRLRSELVTRGRPDLVQRLERPFVGTIHAFCANLLRLRPVEACIDPSFQEVTQPEAQRLFAAVFRPWLTQRITDGSSVLRRFLRVSMSGTASAIRPGRFNEQRWTYSNGAISVRRSADLSTSTARRSCGRSPRKRKV